MEAAEAAAVRPLPRPAITPIRYGVGFLGVHDGRGGNFVFVDWWEQENDAPPSRVLLAGCRPGGSLRAATPADPIACVWALSVLAHEREGWIRHVRAASVPDLYAYLADQLEGEI
jgi:hypothetical protein